MKTKIITKEEAGKIGGTSNFVGTLDECWANGEVKGGCLQVKRLDGAFYIDNDTPSFTRVTETLVNEKGQYWYVTPKRRS